MDRRVIGWREARRELGIRAFSPLMQRVLDVASRVGEDDRGASGAENMPLGPPAQDTIRFQIQSCSQLRSLSSRDLRSTAARLMRTLGLMRQPNPQLTEPR